MANTMEPIQPVTLSLELALPRKTKLKLKQNKKPSTFPINKIGNKSLYSAMAEIEKCRKN